MFKKTHKKNTMLRYWTTRYLITLLAGLLILAAGSILWIRQTTIENRLSLLTYLADETADRVVQQNGHIEQGPFFRRMLEDRSKLLGMDTNPRVFIIDLKGNTIFSGQHMMGRGGPGGKHQEEEASISQEDLDASDSILKLTLSNGEKVYAVKSSIKISGKRAGWAVVLQNAEEITDLNQEYRLLSVLLFGVGLLGWSVIYFLTKRISQPIKEVSAAATLVSEGNYDIILTSSAKEHEIKELIHSFKQMSEKLMQLEKLRAELLAGVTHDLKTPLTSISGLVQAVRDGIVTGDDKQEFLEISLQEIQRLQTMISDLLDFNTYSAGAFIIRPEQVNLSTFVQGTTRQWSLAQDRDFTYEVFVPDKPIFRNTDPLRLQQILINLLNNSLQALPDKGKISIFLSDKSIEVCDTGLGILPEDQPYIFERFFRGENKKLKVRGLGIGLPFSKMIAKSLGANLFLKKSSHSGSVFSIEWK